MFPPFPTSCLQLLCGFLRFFPSSIPSPSPPPSSLLFRYCSCFRPLSRRRSYLVFVDVSRHPVLVPVPALSSSPLSSPFLSCVHLTVSTPVPVSTPSPSPSPFKFPPTTASPSLFPPPTPFALSRPSGPITLSVQRACTDTGPYERSGRVPASATPCLQR